MRRFVESLVQDSRIRRHVVYQGLAPRREARLVPLAQDTPGPVRAAVETVGARRLYSHQAEAIERIQHGKNLLLATPTASGKTLAYLLAFATARQADPRAHALFVYPLKALARDQLATIRRFLAPLGLDPAQAAEVYDGDTPESARRRIRRHPPAVVITNPDMLHLALLSYHDSWAGFLDRLGLVVLDEAHVYRGIFGAHVHHVIRRLLRLARVRGARPRLMAGSATIGDPGQFISTLTGEPFDVIAESGAPAAPRHVLFLEPDSVSPYTLATHLVARAVEAGRKTIAFTKARRITELMIHWLLDSRPKLARRVASYRAGYLPEERREIEARLFSGELAGVISTSALEAGIDVGELDVCVLVGYPGSLATSWQRIGRAGRSDAESLAVLVALPDALDRYVVRHPQHFFSGDFERVVLDPENDTVADAHLQAAAAERSLDPEELRWLGGPQVLERLERLVADGRLTRVHDEQRWFTLRRRPQRDISLRSTGTTYALLRASDRRHLGTLDASRVWFEGHPGAIYLHAGQSYRVLELSEEDREVILEPGEVDYYTQVYARKETEILERFAEREIGPARIAWGRLRVTTFIEGFSKRRLFSQEEISRHALEAPPQLLETVGFWFELPEQLLRWLVASERHPAGSLHAMEHAAIGLFPLLAICDRWDLGGISYAHHPQIDVPAVFIYDGWPGGVGLAKTGYERAESLVDRTHALIADCPCEDGCPACIHSPKCGSGNTPLDKLGAVELLDVLRGVVELEPAALAAEDRLAEALSRHRRVRHVGVRGGEPLPDGFFAGAGTSVAPGEPDGSSTACEAIGLDQAGWPAPLPPPSQLLGPEEGSWLFFDVETLRGAEEVGGWGHIADMGLALAVVLEAREGRFETFWERDVERLFERLAGADRVVGFNVERFDLAVLSGYIGRRVKNIRTLDLLKRIRDRLGFRLGLGHLVEQTLGVAKTADGLQSLQWVREGRFDEIERYCRDDVMLTAALWAYGRQHGYVLFRNRDGLKGRIPVSW